MSGRIVMLMWIMLACAAPVAFGQNASHSPAASDDPRAQLQEIMQQPVYQRWRLRQARAEGAPMPGENYLEAKLREVRERIGDFFRRFFESDRDPTAEPLAPSGASGFTTTLKLFGWLALAIVAVFVIYMVYRAVRDHQHVTGAARVLSREQVREALDQGHALALDSPQWLDEARRLAGAQDFRAVYRALYLALLSGLHTAGRIDYRRNRTNWTYVNRYRGEPSDRDLFGELTRLFDDVWYGDRPADQNIDDVQHKITLLIDLETPRG